MVSISSLLNPILPPPSSLTSALMSPSPSLSPFSTPRCISTAPTSDAIGSLDDSRRFAPVNYLARPLLPPTSSHHPHRHPRQAEHRPLGPSPASSWTSASPHLAKAMPIISSKAASKIRGPVRYPPFESFSSASVLSTMKEFNIQPPLNQGLIAANPRHIPYNSEKKAFFEKTGRESFEVFRYTFQVPPSVLARSNDDEPEQRPTTHTLMWDYTTSLVRITPLFKSLSYSKTTPSKMLSLNPGLREITHSITGGALAAQGYWMPWLAAREVAKTFCWRIRWALVPVFGESFAAECLELGQEGWGVMRVDAAVVRACADECEGLRAWATGERALDGVPAFSNLARGAGFLAEDKGETSDVDDDRNKDEAKEQRMVLTTGAKKKWRERYAESGYGTDTEPEEDEIMRSSPREKLVKLLAQWDGPQRRAQLPPLMLDRWSATRELSEEVETDKRRLDAAMGLITMKKGLPTWVDGAELEGKGKRKRMRAAFRHHLATACRPRSGEDEGSDTDDTDDTEKESRMDDDEHRVDANRGPVKLGRDMARRLSKEARAAYLLMQLQIANQIAAEKEATDDPHAHPNKRRRASTR